MTRALLLFLLLGLAGVGRAADADGSGPELTTRDQWIVILGSFRDFKEAEVRARTVSRASGVPFSLEGKVYDKKRGLILPDDADDSIYAGSYLLRRSNTALLPGRPDPAEYLSVERSEAYPGLRGGYYIIVGGFYDTTREASKALARFRLPAADAYAKKTQVYLGCMH